MILKENIKLLKDLCNNFKSDIVDGPFGSNMKRSDYLKDGIPVLKIQNIKPFSIITNNFDYISESKYNELKRHSFKKGDIIMTKLGNPLGASAIVNNIDDGLIVADLVRIRADKIDTNYLCYHLNSPITNNFINAQQRGATRPRVRISSVRDLPIYTPPLSEQHRIVSILDEAFTAIDKAKANAEQNLKNAKELFESYLNDVFEKGKTKWESKKLYEVCDVRDGTHDSPKYVSKGFPLVTSKNLKNDNLNFENIKYISKKDYDDINRRSKVNVGDVLFAMIGTIGNPVVIRNEPSFAIKNVALFKVLSNLNSTFLKYYLKSNMVKQRMGEDAKGVTQKFVGLGYLRNFEIYLPSIDEQHVKVQLLDSLSQETTKLEGNYLKKLKYLEELKKSILQKAFSGELEPSKKIAV